MKKELSKIYKEMQSMKEEQIRYSKFLPKEDLGRLEEYEYDEKEKENIAIRLLKGILYIIIAIFLGWMFER